MYRRHIEFGNHLDGRSAFTAPRRGHGAHGCGIPGALGKQSIQSLKSEAQAQIGPLSMCMKNNPCSDFYPIGVKEFRPGGRPIFPDGTSC